jgi:calcium-dependent protein kinase|tara:strand:+ start:1083 stop:1403 length:321 start_codon:yes stop_codon:yes gene_type:complete
VTAAVDLRVLLSKQKLRAVFNKLDKDKSDSIDKDEIKSMFKYHDISDQTLQHVMSEYDKNGDGVIQFDEFEDMMIKGFKTKKPALGKRSSGNMEKSDRVTRGSVKR